MTAWRRLFRAHLARAALLLLVLTAACDRAPPPPYLRLEGPAPELEDLPPARAHLIIFWASWCPPCIAEAPSLRKLAQRPPEGLSLVVFSHDASVEAAVPHLGDPLDPAFHLRRDVNGEAALSLGVTSLPMSYLIVGDRLVARFDGAHAWDARGMRTLIARLIRERVDPRSADR